MGSTTSKTSTTTATTVEPQGPKALKLEIAGTPIPVLRTLVKGRDDGRTWYTLRGENEETGKFHGEAIRALAPTLPTTATLDGVVFTLKADPKNPSRMVVNMTVRLPSIGEERRVHIGVSVRKDGNWQLKATVNGSGKGGGSVSPEIATARLGLLTSFQFEDEAA